MASINVKWVEGRQFVGVDSTSHSVVLSSPADGIGMKPSDLLLISLAGCTAYDVVEILSIVCGATLTTRPSARPSSFQSQSTARLPQPSVPLLS